MNSVLESNELVEALEISERAWRVVGKPINGECVAIELSNIQDTYRFVMVARNNHHNIKQFTKLNLGDVVEFELVYPTSDNPDPKVSDYLVVRSVHLI